MVLEEPEEVKEEVTKEIEETSEVEEERKKKMRNLE